VVSVQSTRIGAERSRLDPSSAHQFLDRIGNKARRLGNAKLSNEFETSTSCEFSAMLRIGKQAFRLSNAETAIVIIILLNSGTAP
jgi:hypothetical protein